MKLESMPSKRPVWLTVLCIVGLLMAVSAILFLKIISVGLIVTIYWLWKKDKKGWLWTIVLETISIGYTIAFSLPLEFTLQYSINIFIPIVISLVIIITLLMEKDFFKK